MNSLLLISDVVLDPVVKEIKNLLGEVYQIDNQYEEDVISRLLMADDITADKYQFVIIHSDQLYHQKDQSWQESYLAGVVNFSGRYRGRIIVSNALSASYKASPLKSSSGKAFDISGVYGDMLKELTNQANVFVFDFASVLMNIGFAAFYNYNLGHLYQMPYNKPAIKAIAAGLAEEIRFLSTEEKKVIVVDCDNTLWKGIVGEDGVDGISCDKNAEGILHYSLQLFLKAKKGEGFLLCICSKNNENDVKEAFEKKNFPLQWKDFIVRKINWEDKVSNLLSIAGELNVGTDSLIFIDDNLFELNSTAEMLPGVACLHLSGSYTDFITLTNSFLFRRKKILKDDLEKTGQYEQEQARKETEARFTTIDDFIESLDINLDIRMNDVADLPRLAQMTGKTNQFNFNKRAYNEDELKAFFDKGRVYSLKVSDKYGDYGTVGLIMVEVNGENAMMENYLMSCRALGKKIEYKFYDHVVADLLNNGIALKDIRFKTTDKNIPAQNFLNSIQYGSKA